MTRLKNYINSILFLLTMCTMFFSSFNTVYAKQIIQTKLYYDGKLHNYNAEEIKISINGNYIEKYSMLPVILNGRTLVSARDVFESMDSQVLWNNENREVTVNRGNDNIVMKIDNNIGVKNGTSFKLDIPPKIINDRTMIPIRAVSEALDCDVFWDNNNREVKISYDATIIKGDSDINVFTTESTTEVFTETTTEQLNFDNTNSEQNQNNGLTIVWDQITRKEQNSSQEKRIPINGLDVISPTWFEISNSQGDILDKASIDYVNWAHEQGYKVWALFSNGFDPKITHDTLSNKDIRQKMINQICSYVDTYNLDGINIDFESVAKEDGQLYVDFIRDLTISLKAKEKVVSVDMYIPTPWTAHYNMEEVGKIVDYVIIMAYDEHYSTSKESGSVASINWVDKAMNDASQKVDKNKLIMGMPFYTRRWAEETVNGETKVSSVSMKMQEAYDILVENNAQIIWNEECGQYYGEYTIDNVVRKIWLEDEKSIEEKLKVAKKYGVAGVAGWKRGHEKASVWDIINMYY